MTQTAAKEIVVAPERSNALTPPQMLERALATGASPETLEKFMALHERWLAAEAKRAFDEAMAKAKAEFPPIIKDKRVSYSANSGFMHETLPGIAKLIDPILSKYGLSYRFRTASDATSVSVTCVMTHVMGHSEENTLSGPHDKSGGKNPIQAVGSSVTYLQRYTLKGALGLAASDDNDAADVGTGEPISAEDAQNLRDMLAAKGADEQKFLGWAKVAKIEDIPASHYDSCVNAIQQYKPKAKQ